MKRAVRAAPNEHASVFQLLVPGRFFVQIFLQTTFGDVLVPAGQRARLRRERIAPRAQRIVASVILAEVDMQPRRPLAAFDDPVLVLERMLVHHGFVRPTTQAGQGKDVAVLSHKVEH